MFQGTDFCGRCPADCESVEFTLTEKEWPLDCDKECAVNTEITYFSNWKQAVMYDQFTHNVYVNNAKVRIQPSILGSIFLILTKKPAKHLQQSQKLSGPSFLPSSSD